MNDPRTAVLTSEIMKATGIDPDPEKETDEKTPELTVYERRVKAAHSLASVIAQMNAAKKKIHAPHNDLIKKAISVAEKLEKNREENWFTRQVMEAVIAGHIWMKKAGDKPFNIAMARQGAEKYITEMIESVIYRKRSVGFENCDGNCDCEESCANCPSSSGCGGGGHSGAIRSAGVIPYPGNSGSGRTSGPATPSGGKSSGGGYGGGCGGCPSGC
jgi:hypothetical protein